MRTTRTVLSLAFVAALLASCRAARPLALADSCKCSPREYCRVRSAPATSSGDGATLECLPLPQSCGDSPTCACLGRPIDGCREELGAFTILEPRSVTSCSACGAEEYCWKDGEGTPLLCRVLPARCESTPSCACLLASRQPRPVACDDRGGRIEASIAP